MYNSEMEKFHKMKVRSKQQKVPTHNVSIVKFKLEAGLLTISPVVSSGLRWVEELVDTVNGVSSDKSESPERS